MQTIQESRVNVRGTRLCTHIQDGPPEAVPPNPGIIGVNRNMAAGFNRRLRKLIIGK